jgi:CRP/FNR family transcriptional regulator, dissimilatory nitrate respiration regulator
MIQSLADCPVFTGIPPEELERILVEVRHFKKTYQVGDMIAIAGEPCNYLMCLLEGSVKAEMIDFSGKVIKLEDIRAPEALASAFIFGKNNVFPVNIVANEHVTLIYIPRMDFLKMLQMNLKLLQNYLNNVSSRAQFLSDKIKFLSFKTIKGKIAQYILKQAGPGQDVIELKMPQHALAEFFGVTRPSFARSLGEMAEEGIIKVDRREIRILDRKRLMELVR